ncbi:MAG: amidohydrolase family protein [Limnohabitans sp.]
MAAVTGKGGEKAKRGSVHVGLGVDGSSSADSASLWLEARQAMLVGKLNSGANASDARMALEVATIGGAGCLGRLGEIGQLVVGQVGDVAIWDLSGVKFAGAIADPIEGWLRCGPTSARDTIVHGRHIVRDGHLISNKVEEMLKTHTSLASKMQRLDD